MKLHEDRLNDARSTDSPPEFVGMKKKPEWRLMLFHLDFNRFQLKTVAVFLLVVVEVLSCNKQLQ